MDTMSLLNFQEVISDAIIFLMSSLTTFKAPLLAFLDSVFSFK